MKKFSILISVMLCGVILIFSYASWKEKISSAGKPAEQAVASAQPKETEDEASGNPVETPVVDLERLTAEMDPQVQELFYNRKEQEEKLQFLILGSEAMDSGSPAYAELLKQALDESYAGFVETETMSFDGTSEDFLSSEPKLLTGYDVVLMEPFTLKNNGRVEIETEHQHIQNVLDEILSVEDDAVLVLHPPQPIYGAQFYRTQVTALEEFAELRGYAYIDHWQQWPSTEEELLKEYLTEDSNPNNSGAAVWANALIAYFTGS